MSEDRAYDNQLPSAVNTQRIGDAEREQAASALGEHFAAGRIDRAEFDARLDAAYAARTGADLQPLFADLPEPRVASPRPASPSRRPARPRRRSSLIMPALAPALMLAVVVAVATDGHFPFFIFPMLFFMGAFRRRRGW